MRFCGSGPVRASPRKWCSSSFPGPWDRRIQSIPALPGHFAWTLHPIVYFWHSGLYRALQLRSQGRGRQLFSDELGRVAFVMLLVLSLPIGFITFIWTPSKAPAGSHGALTFLVAVPT